jgi:cob(I)alamin adenosyltransferase
VNSRLPSKVPVEAYRTDRDRLKHLAGDLTRQGHGRFYQAETIRWLLDRVAELENRLDALPSALHPAGCICVACEDYAKKSTP